MSDAPANGAIRRCRVCGNPSLIPSIGLGEQYPSAVFPADLDYHEGLPRLPLNLVICERHDESACGLVQLAHEFDLSAMYASYPYTSSTNTSMGAILKDVVDSGLAYVRIGSGDVVLDIGCNDGTLLAWLNDAGCQLVGIDPAENITPVLSSPRFTRVKTFFSEAAYRSAAKSPARLMFSVAMFYHLGDPITFARHAAACLADDGVWIIQMAYLPAMLRASMYDNIVHEHVGYYAAHQMQWIMHRVGLEVFDVTLNDVYGGSFRVFVKKRGARGHPQTAHVRDLLQQELDGAIFQPSTYERFAQAIEKTRHDLCELCRALKAQGKSIWVYGASTKGNTILQYCGLGPDVIDAAADANPFKIGKYVVGADIPIRDEASMRQARPDYLLALPYSFVDAFIRREADLVSRGTRFIVPLPEVRVAP